MRTPSTAVPGLEIQAPTHAQQSAILTREALQFLVDLHRQFNTRRLELLAAQKERQKRLDAGERPDFLPETKTIRESEWTVAQIPKDLLDRRVEITGPVNRKMIINALNSGASVFMADFEDSNTPTWTNQIDGQANLMEAVRRTITYEDPSTGKKYALNERTAVLLVRPRGWHLDEQHVAVDGHAMSGALFDFGLYFFHNAKALLNSGTGPYFYLPKMESHLEARLWNDAFVFAQRQIAVPHGSIRATVLIETILAAFEMHEFLWELRDHASGLNCGRWDYIFSFIKKFSLDPHAVLPDRGQVTMTTHFLRSYSKLLIQTCHKRNIHAMGGMAAQIPIKNDEKANQEAFVKVRADKEREANDGHDGTWVAHPGLVAVALEAFDKVMKTPNQIDRKREDIRITAQDILQFGPEEPITEGGLRTNVSVGIQYLEAWLGGSGAVPIFNLMEDAATAEISRAQVWQWIRNQKGVLSDGRKVTKELFHEIMKSELSKIRTVIGDKRFDGGRYKDAAQLFDSLTTNDEFIEFLTLPGYEALE